MPAPFPASTALSRRHFVRTCAAGISGTLAAPALLRGQNLNDRLNIAVI
ncbi:MAG: hypothetical protein JNL10_08410, partial [Verrucomicrobiales bacterium]|nr:hypothetical protein [Verrucomicrobiales bacterium]